MSMIFYAVNGALEIHVDNPGYGQISLYAPASVHRGKPLVPADGDPWRRDLHGAEIDEFLTKLTDRALGTEPAPLTRISRTTPPIRQWGVHLPPFMTPDLAKLVLPTFIQAVVLAAAGTDRYERTFPDEGDAPKEPFCVRCNQGTLFSPGPMVNTFCDEFGHTPYGHARLTTWASASAHYTRKHQWWEQDRDRARQDAAIASGVEQTAIDLDAVRLRRRMLEDGEG